MSEEDRHGRNSIDLNDEKTAEKLRTHISKLSALWDKRAKVNGEHAVSH